jgi:tricorn protease-like protein
MIKSVVIDFHIGESITIVSGEDFKIKRVATFDNSTDIIISNISKDKVQQLRELYKSNKEIKIANLPVGDIVIVVDNKQLFQTIIKHTL